MATNEELIALASQLRCPEGTKGIEVAEIMNETNIKMTIHSIDRLNISDNDNILELGHGNCGHLEYILEQRTNLKYYGLETSELMNTEAQRINRPFVENKQASFHVYDGFTIPFSDNYFDKILTVNTIYFWTEPKFLLSELQRIMKPNGKLNITFTQEKFMKQLPFTQFGFNFYDNEKITQLIDKTPFQVISSDTQTDSIKSKIGNFVNRKFTTITLTKKQ